MPLKQISVFLENKSGRLAEVTEILGKGGINLRALSIADTADFGICRLIVNNPDKTLKLLEDAGFTAKETDVLGVEVPDRPGGLAEVMKVFNENGVNIEYLYATLEMKEDKAVVIFRVEDLPLGLKIIEEHGWKGVVEV
ncbi:MAG: ACT domain-containing protein [Spirochaetales bacterium]|nr:ACT domain-containing protein [Spirochaetales bacterium]